MEQGTTRQDQYISPDSPLSEKQYSVSAMDWDTSHDRSTIKRGHIANLAIGSAQIGTAVINTSNIGSLSWSVGTGGTLTLGGVGNGNGVLRVLDSLSTQRVTLDNSGVIITDGKLTFENTTGGTVLDGSGIVSTVVFANDQLYDNTDHSVNGTGYTDIPGGSMTPFVLPRQTNVLVTTTAWGYHIGYGNDGVNVTVQTFDNIDGPLDSFSLMGQWCLSAIDFVGQTASNRVDIQTVSINNIQTLSAGTHTLKIQASESGTSADGPGTLSGFLINYIVLGA